VPVPRSTAAPRSSEIDTPATVTTSDADKAALSSILRPRARRGLSSLPRSAALTRRAKPLRAVATGSERIAAPIRA
jgi:hypothetical protein